MTTRIAIDCDNTLIRYDAVFHRLARERGLADETVPEDKAAVRDAVRAAHGDLAWRELQALAYGPAIQGADLFPGALDALRRWRERGLRPAIVSHKTRYSNLPDQAGAAANRHDLRLAALEFLNRAGALEWVAKEDVLFADSRAQKARLIAATGCAIFVDDLPEVFLEPEFPAGTKRILFAPSGRTGTAPAGAILCRDWEDIRRVAARLLEDR